MRRAESVQDLIDQLHIQVIANEIEAKHDMIREAYYVEDLIAQDYEEFKAMVTHYYQYHWALWYGVDLQMEPDMAYQPVAEVLNWVRTPTLAGGHLERARLKVFQSNLQRKC